MSLETALKSVLSKISGLDVTPYFTTNEKLSIAYKVMPVSGGNVKESQLEARIIGKDLDEVLLVQEKIIKSLDMTINQPNKVEGGISFRSSLSGGGWLFNDEIQVWEYPTLFSITWRYI
ncbi:MAG: hypothetical protein RR945_02780 [Erysipelotrichaceae bacterium]